MYTTGAKRKGGDAVVHQLQPIRRLFEFCGTSLPILPTLIDNTSIHSIIESRRMTPCCGHTY